MPLNHPEIISSSALLHGKIVFHETSLWGQKGWGLPSKYSPISRSADEQP